MSVESLVAKKNADSLPQREPDEVGLQARHQRIHHTTLVREIGGLESGAVAVSGRRREGKGQ